MREANREHTQRRSASERRRTVEQAPAAVRLDRLADGISTTSRQQQPVATVASYLLRPVNMCCVLEFV